ncbi:MAG: hypothetical protein ABEJ69_03930, partial [Candidatus Nanohaloarchaea archaeon]
MPDYARAIEFAIGKEMNTIGKPVALKQADEMDTLAVDEDGKVERIDGDGKDVLEQLVEKYKDISGTVASSLIAYEIRDNMDMDPEDLPENISQ